MFTKAGNSWDGGVVLATGTAANQKLGNSVSISSDGTTIGVGSQGYNPGGLTDAGQVSVFTKSGTSWVAGAGTILGTGTAAIDNYGHAVSVSGDGTEVVVGAPYIASAAGQADMYTFA